MYENFEFWTLLGLCAAFFVAGFVDSISGGGGLITTPVLLLSGIPPQYALGTNKFVVIFGTAIALSNFVRYKKILYKITFISIGFSLIGSYIGTKLILLLNECDVAAVILFLLPVSALVIFIPKTRLKTHQENFNVIQNFVYAPLIAFVIGAYDGFFGPATGTFLILAFYLFLHMDMLHASATAKALNLASGVGSFSAFAFSGHIFYALGFPLIVANVLGAYLGSRFAIKRGVKVVRFFVVLSFMVMFISLMLKYFSLI